MYSEYWNLVKPPFDNVPDASMYVDCHVSMEDVIAETIYAIKEGNECLTVIVGDVGLGKTLSLRVIIDSLEPEKYKVALITNPALSFIQLLREIIGQITGKQCLEKKKVDLLEMFNRLLFETADQGKKIVIAIDEANVLSPSNLDDLRLLTNMQDDNRNLFTLLLVGQMELAHKLEHPKRANLFQRIGTYGHLEKLPSKEAVRDYIEARLRIAGTDRKIFDDSAISVIWEFSEHGVPRLINKICKLCLKAGETNEFPMITGEIASQIADRFQKLSRTRKPPAQIQEISSEKETAPKAVSSQKAAPAVEPGFAKPSPPQQPVHVEPPRMEATDRPAARPTPLAEEERPRVFTPERPVAPVPPPREERPIRMEPPRVVTPERPTLRPIPSSEEERPRVFAQERPPVAPVPPQQPVHVEPPRMEATDRPAARPTPLAEEERPRVFTPERPVAPVPPPREERPIRMEPPRVGPADENIQPSAAQRPEEFSPRVEQPKVVPISKQSVNYVPLKGGLKPASASPQPVHPVQPQPVQPVQQAVQAEEASFAEQSPMAAQTDSEYEIYEECTIGHQKITISIPGHAVKQAQTASRENKNKLAGYWSAQVLKANPQLVSSTFSDPVSLWFEVKNIILKKFEGSAGSRAKMN